MTVDAIEWAVENDMDVINMSLGSAFGRSDDPSAVASTNAAKAGLIVVTSAGNSGPAQYITGSPGTAIGAISTAANDANQELPRRQHPAQHGRQHPGDQRQRRATSFPPAGTPLVVVREASGAISRGCEGIGAGGAPVPGSAPGEFAAAGAAGKIAVVIRGDCARVAKAINGQKAGAVAVIMINNAAALPPFEGQITSNPDTGEQFIVTIPFLGTSSTTAAAFTAAGVASATITPINLVNTNYTGFASFSSGGPTNGTSDLKPDITAPGVSVISTGNGTGNGVAIISGTSMASPHVAGVAALVAQAKQADAGWNKARGEDLKAAIVNTGNPAGVLNNRISRGGTGLVQPFAATHTQAVAVGDRMTASLSYGFEELSGDFSKQKSIEVRNFGTSAITFAVGTGNAAGSPHSVVFDQSSLTVPAGGKATLKATLNVPVATVGNADAFREVAGYVTLTPGAGQNNGVLLRVPYYLVPRALSTIKTGFTTPKKGATSATFSVSNGGPIAGDADFYTYGIDSVNNKANRSSADVRAVGVQSFPSGANRLLVFAVNTYDRWSHPSLNEFDVLVDVDNNGSVDYVVVGVDQGALAGAFNGTYVSAVFSTRSAGAEHRLPVVRSDEREHRAHARPDEPDVSQRRAVHVAGGEPALHVRDRGVRSRELERQRLPGRDREVQRLDPVDRVGSVRDGRAGWLGQRDCCDQPDRVRPHARQGPDGGHHRQPGRQRRGRARAAEGQVGRSDAESGSWIRGAGIRRTFRTVMCANRVRPVPSRRRRQVELERVLGTPALFATAYGNVGSSIYYALGLTAVFALGLTPLVFIAAGIIFAATAATYAEGTVRYPEAGGSSSFARHAFNELVSFGAASLGHARRVPRR